MRNTFFFDLDGTLLPLDMEEFFEAYHIGAHQSGVFDHISREDFGKAVQAMLGNNGQQTNEALFFEKVGHTAKADGTALREAFDGFYADAFAGLKQYTRMDARVGQTIATLKDKGYRLALSTQPVFPSIATDQRIAWAGLDPGDFEYISYYHNSSYCKPNPKYFEEIMNRIGVRPEECYIVGNDVKDDMSAVSLGFEGFLVLDHVVGDVEKAGQCKKGDYSDLLSFVESLPQI